MKAGLFWKKDWFLGLVVTVLFLGVNQSDLVQSLERKAYDFAVQHSSRTPSDRIAVIAIDDHSIANLGRWPWTRNLHAKMTDLLAGANARLVANTVFFPEPEVPAGYPYISKLLEIVNRGGEADVPRSGEMGQIAEVLKTAEAELATDRRLAESYTQAGRVVLPMVFRLGETLGRPDKMPPDYIARHRLQSVVQGGGEALPANGLTLPIPPLGEPAKAIGHLNLVQDVDGGVRTDPLVINYYDQYYPSMALMIAAASLNLGPADIKVRLGEDVQLGKLKISTDFDTQMHPFFYRGSEDKPPFQVDSFYDVLSGKIPASKYADKIVLIGATATGVGTLQVTPVSPTMAPVLTLAHTVSSLLQEHFYILPGWGIWAEIFAFLLVAAYLIVLLPRLSAGFGAVATAGLLLALLLAHFVLMTGPGIWLQLMGAATLLLVGHVALVTKRFMTTEQGKQKADLESAESNRMLGLAFQGQGQLDMAFDKFRKCPLDDSLMDNLYNLALDYERKRQFNKAEAVFRYMGEHNPDFRDLKERLAKVKQMSETVMLGSARGTTAGGTVILGDQVEKPMLGRYQVEKELGKGAMGVVYLGRDPKINRVVAIKTMALAQEFDEDELEDVKSRFFREAETAGRLNHPNIVTMYDAGEEHDLAYIAMEFLKGRDLVPYTKPEHLLPLPRLLSVVARVADALDYAHQNSVVHRDIKPANIMYEPDADQVKVTDFGIARITDSSKTKTGMVLGTPSYMSPEQLAGKKIDGRSDLFSLGVTLYLLSCGRLPFVGESMAQLMYLITNEAPTDILTLRSDLPPALVAVLDRALTKDVEQRYQRGAEMAADLRAVLAEPGGSSVDLQF